MLVIDTNVWLDLLVFDEPSVATLSAVLDRRKALATSAMRGEWEAVLRRSRFGLSVAQQLQALKRFDELTQPVAAAPACRIVCRDPDDQKFLDLAAVYRAQWLISRDKALLGTRRAAWQRYRLRLGAPDAFAAYGIAVFHSDRTRRSHETPFDTNTVADSSTHPGPE